MFAVLRLRRNARRLGEYSSERKGTSAAFAAITALIGLTWIYDTQAIARNQIATSGTELRTYSIQDTLNRRQIGSLAVSPNGAWVAFGLERPAERGDRYVAYSDVDFTPRRNDIRVISASSGSILWVTHEHASRRSAFLPVWSPDGNGIGFLVTDPQGQTRLSVWRLGAARAHSMEGLPLDLAAVLLNDAQGTPAAVSAGPPFAWLDNEIIVAVQRGGGLSDSLGPERLGMLSDRWRNTWSGRASVEVWNNAHRAICGSEDRLVEYSVVHPGLIRILARGAIRGVSISAGSDIAYVIAIKPVALPKLASMMPMPLPDVMQADRYVHWEVRVLPAAQRPYARAILVSRGEGPISAATLPRWSEDARRLAGVTRAIDGEGNVTNGVFLWTQTDDRVRRFAVNSFAAARLIAFQFESTGAMPTAKDLSGDPGATGPSVGTAPVRTARQITDVAVQANSGVAMDARGDIFLVGRAQPLHARHGARFVGVFGRAPHRRVLVRTGQDYELLAEAPRRTAPAIFAATGQPTWGGMYSQGDIGLGRRGDVIIATDTERGSFIDRLGQDRGAQQLAAFNTYFAEIARPEIEYVPYKVNGSERRGILFLPSARTGSARPPVIVWAYPQLGHATLAIANLNQPATYTYPPPFLAAGYGYFVVDFRGLNQTLPPTLAVKENILSEVLPAIAAIQRDPAVDGQRLGFVGISYGGYTALTLLAYTHVFKAIVADAPLGDLSQYVNEPWPNDGFCDCGGDRSLPAVVEIEDPREFLRMGAPEYAAPLKWLENSPSLNLGNATTPTLIEAGEFDHFANGAMGTYFALTRLGVPAELLQYSAEGHVLSSPGNMETNCVYTLKWFDKYLKKAKSPYGKICDVPAT
jgi:acetyl esterase/lipase